MEKRCQDENEMVLKCIWTIELNWMEKYGKKCRKAHILGIFGGVVSVQEMLCFLFQQVFVF